LEIDANNHHTTLGRICFCIETAFVFGRGFFELKMAAV